MSVPNYFIEVAAQWWADQLRSPALLDNGDNSNPMLSMIAYMAQSAEREDLDDSKIDQFQLILEAELVEELKTRPQLCFGVDYHPEPILARSAEKAGIDPGMTKFPWKTLMWINESTVKVAKGYGADAEVIATL